VVLLLKFHGSSTPLTPKGMDNLVAQTTNSSRILIWRNKTVVVQIDKKRQGKDQTLKMPLGGSGVAHTKEF